MYRINIEATIKPLNIGAIRIILVNFQAGENKHHKRNVEVKIVLVTTKQTMLILIRIITEIITVANLFLLVPLALVLITENYINNCFLNS